MTIAQTTNHIDYLNVDEEFSLIGIKKSYFVSKHRIPFDKPFNKLLLGPEENKSLIRSSRIATDTELQEKALKIPTRLVSQKPS